MRFDALTSWLYGRTAGGIKWGLETTETLLAGGGDPHRRFRSLHIGGTNGKGSVAALCASVLREAGKGPVGLYTSPHLVSFRERIQVDGAPVAEEHLLAAARRLEPLIEQTGASFFEATTAMAFLCFAEDGVRTAVVEVGLGGRLDATNVIRPEVSVVTNVALDHSAELGESIEEVAAEKAGIFKREVPAITGETEKVALGVLRGRAQEVGAPLRSLDEVVGIDEVEVDLSGTRFHLRSRSWGERQVSVPLIGHHQARNAALAAEALALLPKDLRPTWDEVERGFAAVQWPGRFQVVRLRGTTWIFDVAHNPAGAAALDATLAAIDLPRPLILVTAILSDKRWEEMLPTLAQRADAVLLTIAPSAPPTRRWDPSAAAAWLREHCGREARVMPDLPAALSRASTLAPHGTVLVTGSVFTVGDEMGVLGVAGGLEAGGGKVTR